MIREGPPGVLGTTILMTRFGIGGGCVLPRTLGRRDADRGVAALRRRGVDDIWGGGPMPHRLAAAFLPASFVSVAAAPPPPPPGGKRGSNGRVSSGVARRHVGTRQAPRCRQSRRAREREAWLRREWWRSASARRAAQEPRRGSPRRGSFCCVHHRRAAPRRRAMRPHRERRTRSSPIWETTTRPMRPWCLEVARRFPKNLPSRTREAKRTPVIGKKRPEVMNPSGTNERTRGPRDRSTA